MLQTRPPAFARANTLRVSSLRVLASLLVLLAGVVSAAAPDERRDLLVRYRKDEAGFGTLFSRRGAISARDDRVEFVTRSLRRVEARLGRSLERDVTLVLVPDFSELSRLVVALTDREPNDSILGMAFPQRRWAIVREDDRFLGTAPWETPLVTLEHELAHLVIHARGAAVPRWLDEGVAMWVSQKMLPPEAEAQLGAYARFGGLFPLAHLEHRFPTEHLPGSLAYRQSFLMVQFLIERHGEAAIPLVLDGLDSGETVEDVLGGLSGGRGGGRGGARGFRDHFEEDFRLWLIARNALFTSIASMINFWTLISLLAIVAIVAEAFRRRKARRRLAARELEEDRDERDGEAAEWTEPA